MDIEVLSRDLPGGRHVMIACDDDVCCFVHALNAAVGIRPVSHQVSQADDVSHIQFVQGQQYGFQGLQVSMNVGYDPDFQSNSCL